MSYVLVKLNANWADEFDINSLAVMTTSEFDRYLEDLNKYFIPNVGLYFGTNEWVEFEDVSEITSGLESTPISYEFYLEFKRVIGKEFGMFGLYDILGKYKDRYQEELEENEE